MSSESKKVLLHRSDKIRKLPSLTLRSAKEFSAGTVEKVGKISRDALETASRLSQDAAEKASEQMTRGVRMTRSLGFHLAVFSLRLLIFLSTLIFYLTNRKGLAHFMNQMFFAGITPVTVLWVIFMCIMVTHLIPNNRLSMAWRKMRENTFRPAEKYDRRQLLENVQRQNVGAWKVLLVWLSGNAVIGLLYLFGILEAVDLLMLTVFYYLCDYICILFFCPFQKFLMKNKCCINCRIFDWGHFMMFTPMLFIKNFFSWSLFFMSVIVLIHWEIVYAQHPERFWEGSNLTICCGNCKEETCQIKKKLAGQKKPLKKMR